MTNDLFEGIDKLTTVLGERYKAIDKYNDFAIRYVIKHDYKYQEHLLYETFNRWASMYVYKSGLK